MPVTYWQTVTIVSVYDEPRFTTASKWSRRVFTNPASKTTCVSILSTLVIIWNKIQQVYNQVFLCFKACNTGFYKAKVPELPYYNTKRIYNTDFAWYVSYVIMKAGICHHVLLLYKDALPL